MMSSESPKYRHLVQEVLSLGSPVKVRAPDGDIGFYVEFANGRCGVTFCESGKTFSFNLKTVEGMGLSRLEQREVFPVKIWSWDADSALAITYMLDRIRPEVIKEVFRTARDKKWGDFEGVWPRMLDVISTIGIEQIPEKNRSRWEEASRDAYSLFYVIAKEAYEGTVAACKHDRLNEEGYCRTCSADCRGIGGGA